MTGFSRTSWSEWCAYELSPVCELPIVTTFGDTMAFESEPAWHVSTMKKISL